jgi:hypothetical protein
VYLLVMQESVIATMFVTDSALSGQLVMSLLDNKH